MALVRYDLGGELDELRREVNQIFSNLPGMPGFAGSMPRERFVPAMDTYEHDGNLCVTLDLPGMSEKDIDVEIHDDVLAIRGTRSIDREKRGDNWYRSERASGMFERRLQLPQPVDAGSVHASFDGGVLTVEIPLPQLGERKPQRVAITSGNGAHRK